MKEIDDCGKDATDEIFLSREAKMSDMLKRLDELEVRVKDLESTATKYQSWQEVLQTNQSTFDNLSQLREDFNIRGAMWRSLKEWESLTNDWVKTQFALIDAPSIEKQAVTFSKVANRVEKNLPENPVAQRLKDLVETFKGTMPIVVALRCPDLKDNHWKEI